MKYSETQGQVPEEIEELNNAQRARNQLILTVRMPTDLEKEEGKVLNELDEIEAEFNGNASPINRTQRANKEF